MVEVEKGTPEKILYKCENHLGTKLIKDNEEESKDTGGVEFEELVPIHKKRKISIKPVPFKENRTKGGAHLPAYGTRQCRCTNNACNKKKLRYFAGNVRFTCFHSEFS
ncbi:hypothetical protein HHI36_017315 [Cryptolaemus montrouzieri]|uniref:Uncharacterized protein n=1 Tax=Cryptolaemus montrouzieri TaxID=559131 RepID=A0ABD2NMW7_9CUCU